MVAEVFESSMVHVRVKAFRVALLAVHSLSSLSHSNPTSQKFVACIYLRDMTSGITKQWIKPELHGFLQLKIADVAFYELFD